VAGVGAGARVRGAAEVQVALVHRSDAADRAGGGVRRGVVGDAVGRDRDSGVGFGDRVRDRAAGVVVVAGGVGEGPGVAGIGAGVGVRGAGEIQVALVDR